MNVLQTIGNTPFVQLCKNAPPVGGAFFAKLEGENPTGSMKDRKADSRHDRNRAD